MKTAPAVAALAAFLACSPYDPNLGPAPFLCGTDDPRCPDGYTAVTLSPIRCECQLAPHVPDAGDAYRCNVDLNEPNDDPHLPTVTHVGQNDTDNFSNVSICPADNAEDDDNYGLTVPQARTLIEATVTFDTARQPPAIDFLDSAGVSLHPTITPSPATLIATYTAGLPGMYVVRLSGSDSVNYSLRIQIFPPQ